MKKSIDAVLADSCITALQTQPGISCPENAHNLNANVCKGIVCVHA
jgi:hypothetical protein